MCEGVVCMEALSARWRCMHGGTTCATVDTAVAGNQRSMRLIEMWLADLIIYSDSNWALPDPISKLT